MKRIIILDTETDGIDTDTCALLECAFAVYDLELATVLECGAVLLPSDRPNASAHMNGISDAAIASSPYLPTDAAKAVTSRMIRYGITHALAHNARFDQRVMDRFLPDGINPWPWVDSYKQIRWPFEPDPLSLTSLALRTGVGVVRAHRAIEDCLTLADVMTRHAWRGVDLCALIQQAADEPMVTIESLAPFSRKDDVKAAGFHWLPDLKVWRSYMRRSDVSALSFQTREVAGE